MRGRHASYKPHHHELLAGIRTRLLKLLNTVRLLEKTDFPDENGCWNWLGSTVHRQRGLPGTAGSFRFGNNSQAAYRASYELLVGPIPPKAYVMHKCDNPMCVNPAHLFLGTHLDNMLDKTLKGRASRKLTKEQVLAIRADKRPQRQIAADFNVTQGLVSAIRKRRVWNWV